MTRFLVFFLFFLSACSHSTPTENADKITAGWVENVCVEGQEFLVKAKLDSRAKTSSIYAEDIERFTKDNEKWVRFTLVLKDHSKKLHRIPVTKEFSRRVKIKNHDGEHDRRVTVDLDLIFAGKAYTTEFTLVDRNEYIYPVLLGRSFLADKIQLDTSKTLSIDTQCTIAK